MKAGEAELYMPHVVAWSPQHDTLAYRGPFYDERNDQAAQQQRHFDRYSPYPAYAYPPQPSLRIVPYALVTIFSAPR